jgi:hypothetical protein
MQTLQQFFYELRNVSPEIDQKGFFFGVHT